MQKIKRNIFLLLTLLLIPVYTCAKSIEPDYEIEEIYINATIDILGSMHIQEAYVVKGSLNGFSRKVEYKNNFPNWETGKIDFYGSSIYNGRSMSLSKVSSLKIDKEEIGWNLLDKDFKVFREVRSATVGDKEVYTNKEVTNGIEIKTYAPNESGYTVFYYDYYVNQVVVLHNDVAELYYNFLKSDTDTAKNVNIQVLTPWEDTDETFRFWAHGAMSGEIRGISEAKNAERKELFKGVNAKIDNYDVGDSIEIRMTFNKDGFGPSAIKLLDNSEMDAFDRIIEVETERANETNRRRMLIKVAYYGSVGCGIVYLLGLVGLWIYVYRKYDKEYDSTFDHKYYREFTGDYEVEVVDYLMNKSISTKAFSASLMNLIYKKNIAIEEIPENKKKEILLILKSPDNTSEAEKELIELLFTTIGKENKVTLKEIEKYSKKATTAEKFMKRYDTWKVKVENDAINEEFFESHTHVIGIAVLYLLLGLIIIGFQITFNIEIVLLPIAIFIGGVSFFIYTLTFKKWTRKGREHYLKWNAFQNFLNDFGSFKDKEVPEIALWDKYLVYATVFGIAKKVQESMKVQLSSMNVDEADMPTFTFSYSDFYLFNAINNSISRTYTNSVNTINAANASSAMSSGGGFGGGFSGGSGGAGGGGGSFGGF